MQNSFQIDKEFHFEYGHRVWSQKLDATLSDGLCKCRHLHGHSGRLKIGLSADVLEDGMVTDFKHLDFIKRLVDDVFDHKFILDINDPLIDSITYGAKLNDAIVWLPEFDGIIGKIDEVFITEAVQYAEHPELRELLESFVIVQFVPTSENLCKMFGELANQRLVTFLEPRARVEYVDFYETAKSHCRYVMNRF